MRPLPALLSFAMLLQTGVSMAAQPVQIEVHQGSSLVQIIPASTAVSPAPAPPAGGYLPDDRATWHLQATVSGVLKSVSFADPMTGYIAAELGVVYKTTNGGQSWTRIMALGFPYYWYGVQAFTPQTALIVGFQNQSGAGVARWTDDGGVTWTSDLVIDPANWLLAVKFADPLHGVAYGNLGYVYATQNGGRNATDWTKVTTDPAHGWLAGNFTFRPDLNVYATGIKFCHSTDGGYTWTIRPSADYVFDGGCSFPDLLHGWTGGGQISNPVSGWVHRTTDGGATWSGRLMQPPYPIRIVQFFDENFGFAAGGNYYGNVGGIWSTTDTGTTWNLDVNTGAEMSAIDYQGVSADSTDVWCVGYSQSSGVIYKARIGKHSPAGVPGAESAAALSARAVPNPFHSRTRISLGAAAGGSSSAPAASAAILDLSGRLVRSITASGGALEWDGRDATGREVPAGVYLVRSQAYGGSTLRVIRIR